MTNRTTPGPLSLRERDGVRGNYQRRHHDALTLALSLREREFSLIGALKKL